MDNLNIMAILIKNRTDDAAEVQKILTKYGCIIETLVHVKTENIQLNFNE